MALLLTVLLMGTLLLYILSTIFVIGGTFVEEVYLRRACYGIGGTMGASAILFILIATTLKDSLF